MVHYPSIHDKDREWGLSCICVGKCDGEAPAPIAPGEHRLIYITGGSALLRSDSCPEASVSEGDVIVAFEGENFTLTGRGRENFSQMWVGFRVCDEIKGRLERFFDRHSPVLGIGSSDTVYDLYGRLMYLAGEDKPGCQEAMGGFIYALLGYVHHKSANLSTSQLKYAGKIQQAQLMLRSDLSSHICPARVASDLGMSYSLMREQFKAVTGMSMAEYRTTQRINLAKTLLSSSSKSIKEISFDTGYESMTRFCCAFKKAVGIPAKEFRLRTSK